MSEAPWKKSTEPVLVLYSILAALAGLFLTYSLGEKDFSYPTCLTFDIPLFLSIMFFIYSAEIVTDALDESDVKKILYSYLSYNLAVVCLIWGMISSVYVKFYHGHIWDISIKRITIDALFLGVFIIASWKWAYDFCWLMFRNKHDYHDYILELEGKTDVASDYGLGMKIFYKYRKCLFGEINEFVFQSINIELRPSPISGIGLFALKKFVEREVIAEGIHLSDIESIVLWSQIKGIDTIIEKKIKDFCVGTPEGFYPPEGLDFNNLTADWYMNHSCNGNVGFNEVGDFIALRNIEEGEELSYDYALAESNPQFTMQCTCKNVNCRKRITGNDWKNKEIIQHKINYMLPALREEQKLHKFF